MRSASSAQINPAISAMMPPASQAPRTNAGVCTRCATTYGFMKMPAPTMPPITSMVESNRPRRRASGCVAAGASADRELTGFDGKPDKEALRSVTENKRPGQPQPGGLGTKVEGCEEVVAQWGRTQA